VRGFLPGLGLALFLQEFFGGTKLAIEDFFVTIGAAKINVLDLGVLNGHALKNV
jgi:hypothetical protein